MRICSDHRPSPKHPLNQWFPTLREIGCGTAARPGILDERFSQSILLNALVTHADGPIFLNILRYTDLPEAAALMAPRRVTFYGAMPAAYGPTPGDLHALRQARDNLSLTMGLESALAGRHHHNFSSGL